MLHILDSQKLERCRLPLLYNSIRLRNFRSCLVAREAGMLEIKYLLIPALFFVFWAFVSFRQYQAFKRRTATAQGKVLRVRFGRLHLGTNVPKPEIEFVDSHGRRVEFHSSNGASWNPWPVGSTVQVFYDPEDPTNAEIKPTRGMTLFMVGFGSLLILGSGLVALLRALGN